MTAPGALVLVGTPIGNRGDLSPRVVEALATASLVCCEDTRRTGRLLQHAGVKAERLRTVNDHTEVRAIVDVLRRIAAGERVAVVTDAGMPGISDPGERLVRAAVAAGCTVEVVPGPSAVIAALVTSGLPTGRFVFEGFLPRKGSARTGRLAALAREERTTVLYEAPHRLARTLADLAAACGGDRRVAIARELTKLHEEVWRGTLDEAVAWAEEPPRGELVLTLAGAAPPTEPDDGEVETALREVLASGASARDAAAEVAESLAVPRKRAYRIAIALGRDRGVIQDPSDELVEAVRRSGDDPSPADRAALALVQRRFGLSLPLPFARLPAEDEPVPVRAAVAVDGPAVAATKWRSWRLAYEGILPAEFLAGLAVYPPAGYWTGRAVVPPTNRHGLFVAGPRGSVFGLVSVEPWSAERDERRHLPTLDPATTSEIRVMYVDPLVQRRGVGRGLLDAAIEHARSTGACDLRLWTAERNGGARAFYEAQGWEPDGERQRFELEPGVEMDEVRYRYTRPLAP